MRIRRKLFGNTHKIKKRFTKLSQILLASMMLSLPTMADSEKLDGEQRSRIETRIERNARAEANYKVFSAYETRNRGLTEGKVIAIEYEPGTKKVINSARSNMSRLTTFKRSDVPGASIHYDNLLELNATQLDELFDVVKSYKIHLQEIENINYDTELIDSKKIKKAKKMVVELEREIITLLKK